MRRERLWQMPFSDAPGVGRSRYARSRTPGTWVGSPFGETSEIAITTSKSLTTVNALADDCRGPDQVRHNHLLPRRDWPPV